MAEKFILKIFRGNPGKQYWEEFELEITPFMNVISALMEIQKNPVNTQGKRVEPVVWEQGSRRGVRLLLYADQRLSAAGLHSPD